MSGIHPYLGYILTGSGLFLFALIIWAFAAGEKEWRENLGRVAGEFGFEPFPDGRAVLPGRLRGFRLFRRTFFKQLKNSFRGKHRHFDVSVFDLSFAVLSLFSHKHPFRPSRAFVICFRISSPKLPVVSVHPKGVSRQFAFWHSNDRMSFPEYPVFDKGFAVRGLDEQAIRKVFSHDLVSIFERERNLSMEAMGDTLLMYRFEEWGRTHQEIRALVQSAFDAALVIDAAC